jgi:hypothetical protein
MGLITQLAVKNPGFEHLWFRQKKKGRLISSHDRPLEEWRDFHPYCDL